MHAHDSNVAEKIFLSTVFTKQCDVSAAGQKGGLVNITRYGASGWGRYCECKHNHSKGEHGGAVRIADLF